ncbi:polysaccharide lyase family 7 protein [Paracoccus sp. JM45]|uniref:polysaccharide lyase family 7 protein n=1 Tax=Paracoccus sp. JM45 TaxID=2283626 RepID=UPI000E6D42C9|nr:polysaccharide lyase family 7 protein [Paracoccus sp. JM45]RJE79151.1 polysaccharide lyase family 7 protein [Paracoccus sp. JM45]
MLIASTIKFTALSAVVGTAASFVSHVYAQPVGIPADKFDLSQWNITVPLDMDGDEKVDTISVADLQTYSHPDFFYLNDNGEMVFTTPNKAITTPNSSNSRSELRQMPRGTNTELGTHSPGNNFALQANPAGEIFGGRLNATLKVNHVAKRAGYPDKFPAYSMVVGQIHADKNDDQIAEGRGFGYGNEPLKIYYKKWPGHEKGSVFWNYERNLSKDNPDREDVSYLVWGNSWDNPAEPGDSGISLGEEFSYEVNVHGDIMSLTFEAAGKETMYFQINLADNIGPDGNPDPKDNPNGYAEDLMYFKAGAYDQCSTQDSEGMWYPACPGTGDWNIDKTNGDYASVSFSKLVLGEAVQK